jgi:hypothetical protein
VSGHVGNGPTPQVAILSGDVRWIKQSVPQEKDCAEISGDLSQQTALLPDRQALLMRKERMRCYVATSMDVLNRGVTPGMAHEDIRQHAIRMLVCRCFPLVEPRRFVRSLHPNSGMPLADGVRSIGASLVDVLAAVSRPCAGRDTRIRTKRLISLRSAAFCT